MAKQTKRPKATDRQVTAAELTRFKDEFTRQMGRLNLNRYTVQFRQEDLPDAFATIEVHRTDMVASVVLCSKLHSSVADDWVERTAKHEVSHLLIADLAQLASQRFNVSDDEVYRACEAVCNAMEGVL